MLSKDGLLGRGTKIKRKDGYAYSHGILPNTQKQRLLVDATPCSVSESTGPSIFQKIFPFEPGKLHLSKIARNLSGPHKIFHFSLTYFTVPQFNFIYLHNPVQSDH